MTRAWILVGCLVLVCARPCAAQSNPRVESRAVEEKREVITRINLLNGLGLTQDQLRRLRRLLVVADDIRGIMLSEQQRFEETCLPAFEELEKVVWAGQPVPRELYERCKALDDGNRVLANRYLRMLQPVEEKLAKVLTPAQLATIEDHAECMVPAPQQQDPEKIGQAGNGFAHRALLAEVRKLPEAEFRARQPALLKRLVDGVEGDFGLLGPRERDAFLSRCRQVLEEVRGMSRVQFALKAGGLARELDPQVQDIRLKNQRVAFDVSLVGGLGKVGRNLLDVRLLPVVTDRMAALASTPTSPAAGSGLKAGPAAETCGPRGCSVARLR